MTKTIAIIYNKALKPETEVPAKNAMYYLKTKGVNVKVNPKIYSVDIEAAIVYGGDGLLLYVANKASSCNIPIIGINYGRTGYLCKVKRNENYSLFWKKILNHEYGTESRTRIMAEIIHSNEITEVVDALNEILIGGIDKTVYLNLYFNPQFSTSSPIESIGDGIIFSTKTGSTAHNVSAGGSVLLTEAFSIVANNPLLFKSDMIPINTKSLVVDVSTQFQVEIVNKNRENVPHLVADGQRKVILSGNEKIIIKKSVYDTKFIIL